MSWITESDSPYPSIEHWETQTLLEVLNAEDCQVPLRVREVIPKLAVFIEALVERMRKGGRLIYVGSGTSGRLGVLDAAECPPTFGAGPDQVIGIIAGGEAALKGPVEAAEDDTFAAVKALEEITFSEKDTLFAISASGRTPFVLAAARYAREKGALTGCFTANPYTPLAEIVQHPIVVITGPEVLTGSTRLKAGTATKLVLNMITTATFARLGHVKNSRMIDLQLVNQKLWHRAIRYLSEATGLSTNEAEKLLRETGSLRAALVRATSSQ
ncbi:MAG: N-acetylmuramic acid 6-phosphate etherase [Bacteroidia bacterium]|nr:N-acetylmuramic acid 6-phosphate etherase [Bacteroidia bacterium]MDW8133671.1 N-acetylmuramic acid 6-phosphate etherase [Bacteroidia bacterium]